MAELSAIYHSQPGLGWPLRVMGHAILTTGLILLIQPMPKGILAAFVRRFGLSHSEGLARLRAENRKLNVFCIDFFWYYNNEHRHSGIPMHTPASAHDGS